MGNCISRPHRRSTSYYPEQSFHKAPSESNHKKSRLTRTSVSTNNEGNSRKSPLLTSPAHKEGASTHSSTSATPVYQPGAFTHNDLSKYACGSIHLPPPTSPAHHDDDSTPPSLPTKDKCVSTRAHSSPPTNPAYTVGGSTHSPLPAKNKSSFTHLPPPTSSTHKEGSYPHPSDLSNSQPHQEDGSTHPNTEGGSTQLSLLTSKVGGTSYLYLQLPTNNNNHKGITHSQTDHSESSNKLGLESHSSDPIMTSRQLVSASKPGKPMATDITSKGIEIEWTKPEQGAQNVTSYKIFYCSATDPVDQWRGLQVNGDEERTTVSQLTEKNIYYFKIQSVCEDGYQSESDVSEPITMESLTLTNVLEKVWKVRAKWYNIGLQLGIEACDLDAIQKDNYYKSEDCLREMIKQWLNRTKGSWRKLIDALNHETVGFHDLAKSTAAVNIGLSASYENHEGTSPAENDRFKDHLKTLYASLTPTQVSADTWPPSATRKVFNLAMIKTTEVRRGQIQDEFIRQTITGKVDDILHEKCPIQLKDILQNSGKVEEQVNEDKRKVVLLEGAPGCGKSTLSVFTSQQWGEGKLFQEFKYVILVRLRDPTVQIASCIADLLPGRDDEMRQQAAIDITANDGQGVLFILDGWDELPSNLSRDSIFHKMIQPGLNLSQSNPLLKSTVIVTSRPIASGGLHKCVSSRIEILGFTPKELNEYFTECLKGDTKAVQTLLDRIQENPAIAGSCYLPMNASILVHLFIIDNNTLPTTQYDIFSELVLSCIYRHHNERTENKNLTLESLQLIPKAIRETFMFLCKLAYQGVMDDKVIFSNLPADVNTLGLLQGVESFVRRGKAVSYNFLHLSIQEVLAGFYIATQLTDEDQVSKFNELFNKSRFSAVFQFYAAITKLQTPGIKDVVITIARSHDTTLFLSLLHCLYEAQYPPLCESVAQQLQHWLNLARYNARRSLTPSDCLCIGYFLSHVCKMAAGEFKVNISNFSIGDQGCKYLGIGLNKTQDTHSAVTTLLNLYLEVNVISDCGVNHLSTLLKVGCIENLSLNGNELKSLQGNFIEQLKSNTTLRRLDLSRCSLTSMSSLAEALATNKHLEVLNISNNPLCDDGIQCLAQALPVNHYLKVLCLNSCGITDVGLEYLAKSIQHNSGLNTLSITNLAGYDERSTWHLRGSRLFLVLIECLPNNKTLTSLTLSCVLGSFVTAIEEAVNDVREQRGLPLLTVDVILDEAD